MTEKVKKSEKLYLVLDDLSYFTNGGLVQVKKGVESDVFLNVDTVPQESLDELVTRELVKVISVGA